MAKLAYDKERKVVTLDLDENAVAALKAYAASARTLGDEGLADATEKFVAEVEGSLGEEDEDDE